MPESPHPPPPPPPPAKRDPRRIGFFDLPRSVRERVYAHYFTYPRGLYLHLVYSGHFPRPLRHRSNAGRHAAGAGGGIESLTLRSRDEDQGDDSEDDGDDEHDDEDDEWPFPSETPFPSTSFLFSTVQDTPLRPGSDTPTAGAMSPPALWPNDPFYSHSPSSPSQTPLHTPSTRQRLQTQHVSLPPPFHAYAALLRTSRALHSESHSHVWTHNAVHVITAPPSHAPFLDANTRPRDGTYHLHLGLVPAGILGAIRTLGLSGEVVGELPPRRGGRGVDEVVVLRRVWGVVEREMGSLRGVVVGGGGDGRVGVAIGGVQGARFLRWVLAQEGVRRGWCRVWVEGGVVEGGVDGGEGIEDYYTSEDEGESNGSGSATAMAARMELPKGLREVTIRMQLPERLRRDFEALSWGDNVRPVRVGTKTEIMVQQGGREVRWRAVVYEMRRQQESGEKGGTQGLAEKVHALYTSTTTRHEQGDGEPKSLSDTVYDKLRRMS